MESGKAIHNKKPKKSEISEAVVTTGNQSSFLAQKGSQSMKKTVKMALLASIPDLAVRLVVKRVANSSQRNSGLKPMSTKKIGETVSVVWMDEIPNHPGYPASNYCHSKDVLATDSGEKTAIK